MSVHRTLDGDWVECADSACELKFHVPELSVEEVTALPLTALLPIFEAADKPIQLPDGSKVWGYHNKRGDLLFHREYDLPAVIWPDGTMEWWEHGRRHRRGGMDRFAVVFPDHRPNELWLEGRKIELRDIEYMLGLR